MRRVVNGHASISISISAFWACSRFSAWSHTAERGAVEHLGGDLLARVGGQAVQRDGVLARAGQQRVVEPVGSQQLAPRGRPSSSSPMLTHTSV